MARRMRCVICSHSFSRSLSFLHVLHLKTTINFSNQTHYRGVLQRKAVSNDDTARRALWHRFDTAHANHCYATSLGVDARTQQ